MKGSRWRCSTGNAGEADRKGHRNLTAWRRIGRNLRRTPAAMVLGSPDEVAEQLEAYAALGVDEFCYGGNYGLDPARTRSSLELFVERVMPRFESRRATRAAAGGVR